MRGHAILFVGVLVITCVASALMLHSFAAPLIGIDDANIFFAYAKNVAAGRGCVYAGNNERVEGFTSLLWMLVCAGAFAVSSSPEMLLLGISCVLTAAAIVIAAGLLPAPGTSEGLPRGRIVAIYLAIIFVNAGYLAWTTVSLMDTSLWSFWLVAGTLSFAFAAASVPRIEWRQSLACTLCIAGALLSRPEAMLLAILWIFILAIVHLSAGARLRATLLAVAPMVASLGIVLSGLVVFRLLYFGYPLPNTYYAKVSASPLYNLSRGVIYLGNFLEENPVPCAVVLVAFPLFAYSALFRSGAESSLPSSGDYKKNVRMDWVIAAGIVGGVAPCVLAGGDHFPWFRFLQPVWPLFVVFGLRVLTLPYARLLGTRPQRSSDAVFPAIMIVGLICSIAVTSNPSWILLLGNRKSTRVLSGMYNDMRIAREGRSLGTQLTQIFQDAQKPRIGVITAGGIAVTYDGPIDDLLGLNNVAMAHNPGPRRGMKNHAAFDRSVFFKLQPDIVVHCDVPKPGKSDTEGFNTNFLRGIFNDQEFRRKYTPITIETRPKNNEAAVTYSWWVRNDFLPVLERLQTISLRVIEIPPDAQDSQTQASDPLPSPPLC